MKKSTMNMAAGILLSAGGAALAIAAMKKRSGESANTRTFSYTIKDGVIEDTSMRNSERIDQIESVDADKVDAEKGLTQYDSALRAEWVANGFPQTRMEIELEEQDI
ncbi:hypothetical protein [Bacillus sp. UMB0728]|uniref:hypothetical protein n=1 Tax=Bacillus sp. UMB0728 TaxID=2066052 RepID=UPI000C76DD7F|nr:hypothetical protein [Bacillus sp. UMB0728]PLR74809.1 hypothetical protein CYJ37_04090 [Bacillus sp. UMB0728]